MMNLKDVIKIEAGGWPFLCELNLKSEKVFKG
jgi:hypothetical protein